MTRGVYWSLSSGAFFQAPADGSSLPGEPAEQYVRVPILLVMVAGPLMGLGFVFFLPLVGRVGLVASLEFRLLRLAQRGFSMDKYGLSTDVLVTYLQDFHGMTVSLASKETSDTRYYEAVCTDCHGIHEIVSTRTAWSPVIKENLVETCRQCHTGATENFPSVWLSHYRPSLAHAPLVFLTKTFYRLFIPTVVGGLVIQVGLNLWRAGHRC